MDFMRSFDHSVKIESMPQKTGEKKLVRVGPDGWAMAVVTAFAQHKTLILSPKIVWIVICYGTAKHVDLSVDTLRNKPSWNMVGRNG
jgi:hypothetical protein